MHWQQQNYSCLVKIGYHLVTNSMYVKLARFNDITGTLIFPECMISSNAQLYGFPECTIPVYVTWLNNVIVILKYYPDKV